MVNRRQGEAWEGRGLMEIGVQPGRALHQGLRHFLRTAKQLRKRGGLRRPAKVVRGGS